MSLHPPSDLFYNITTIDPVDRLFDIVQPVIDLIPKLFKHR